MPTWILLEKSTLLCHINIDSSGRRVGVAQQIFDDLNVRSHLNEQATAGVAQGVRSDLRIVDADDTQTHLYHLGDSRVE